MNPHLSSSRMLKRLADNRAAGSLANRLRRRRFAFFSRLLATVPRPLSILDVGGTASFWQQMEFSTERDVRIVLLNLVAEKVSEPNFESLSGDACDLKQFKNASFDVVFSNSVIEHVGGLEAQRRMADEVRRVGRRYFVQTPNYFFPLEPHTLVPFFQFLPKRFRAELIQRYRLGWVEREPTLERAQNVVAHLQLLSERQVRELFPNCRIYRERFLGLCKSITAFGGW